MTRSVYPYLGGKFYELKWILPLIPVHNYYYEAFFGSGVILLNKPKSEEEFANDINSRLVKFWLCLQNKKLMEELQERCLNTLDSRYLYNSEMNKYKENLSLIDNAFNFLYLVKFGFNSYPNTYYTPLTHKMFKIKNFSRTFKLTAERLQEYYDRIKDVRFTDYDFREFLKKNKPQKGKFILLDPPYLNTHGYDKDFCKEASFGEKEYLDMRELLEKHTEGGSYWMITCNQINKYFDGMKNTRIELVDRRACINKNKERVAVKTKIIMNYDVYETGSILDVENEGEGDLLLI